MRITFHGHACFELHEGDATVLVDPFLTPNNPAAQVTAEEVDPTHVLLTHGHGDHIADAVAVAKRTGAHCVAITELAHWLKEQGVEEVTGPNLGGTVPFDWGRVKVVPAWHTNTTPDRTVMGAAAGLVIELGGVTVYHLGDTALFSDLRLIGERESPDVAIVPIGGHFTMDRHDAAYACELIGAGTVIPCHYDTFSRIETTPRRSRPRSRRRRSPRWCCSGPARRTRSSRLPRGPGWNQEPRARPLKRRRSRRRPRR
jgi:L-ascorbate metabolism protein UlaG (beta-lactamase superfamily)